MPSSISKKIREKKYKDKEVPNEHIKGVNTASTLRSKGTSDVGAMARNPRREQYGENKMNAAKDRVRSVLEESRAIKPKIQGLAEGGEVTGGPMKSAAKMSLEIRARKKAMDATDEQRTEQDHTTEDLHLDHHHAEHRDEHPSAHQDLMHDSAERAHEEHEPDDKRTRMFAKGGMAEKDHRAAAGIIDDDAPEGVNRVLPRYDKEKNAVTRGESHMGKSVRRGDMLGAKKVAYSTLKEGRRIRPDIKGLAEGGEVSDAEMKRKQRLAKRMGR